MNYAAIGAGPKEFHDSVAKDYLSGRQLPAEPFCFLEVEPAGYMEAREDMGVV